MVVVDDGAALQSGLNPSLPDLRVEPHRLGEVIRRPGAKAHDWFAGVRPGKGAAKLMLLPIHDHPELLEGASAALRKRRTGASLFTLRPGDEALLPELEQLVARAFDIYVGTPPGAD